MYEYNKNGKMESSYAPSNFELLHPWNAHFYMETTGYDDSLPESQAICEAWALMTERALRENLPEMGIVEFPNGEQIISWHKDSISDYFDWTVEKDTIEVVRDNNGNVCIFNERGKRLTFKSINDAKFTTIINHVRENLVGEDFDDYVDEVKKLGITNADLLADVLADYLRC